MKTFTALTKRNIKVFFKDKGAFFSSLITPVILLVLYCAFLARVYKESFAEGLNGRAVSESLINGTVAGQLSSSLLAVCCVTVAFCSNMLCVSDRANGTINDLLVSPVRRSTVAAAYSFASFFSTIIITFAATAACLVYVGAVGFYMSFADVILLLLDVLLVTAFGTALSSVINAFLSSQGQVQAVGTIVSAGYGFVCGAYMPISQSGAFLRNLLAFLPGTYGTSLMRNHCMNGAFAEMAKSGFPTEAVEGIKDSVDCNVYFFGNRVEEWVMYLVVIGSILLLTVINVLIYNLREKKR